MGPALLFKQKNYQEKLIFAAITLVSFLVFLRLKTPFIMYPTDEFGYLTGSILLKRSPLFLGRFGLILPYHLIFRFYSSFSKISLLEAHQVFKNTALVMASFSVGLWYLLTQKFFRKTVLSLCAVALFLTNYSLLIDASAIMTDIPFLFLFITSLWLLKTGLDRKNQSFLLASAVLFGLSTSIREQALFFLPWLFIIFFNPQDQTSFRLKSRTFLNYLLLAGLTALVFPGYFFLTEGQTYIRGVKRFLENNHNSYVATPVLFKAEFFFNNVPLPILALFAIGVYCLARRQTLVSICLLIPFAISIATLAPMARLYLPLWLPMTGLASYGLYQLIKGLFNSEGVKVCFRHFPKKPARLVKNPTELTLVFFVFAYTIFLFADYSRDIHPGYSQASQAYLDYRNYLLSNVPSEKVLFLVGDKTWLINSYLAPLLRPQWEVIPSGWSWPGQEEIEKQINSKLSQGYLILVDPPNYRFSSKEMKVIINLARKYRSKPFGNSLFQITKPE